MRYENQCMPLSLHYYKYVLINKEYHYNHHYNNSMIKINKEYDDPVNQLSLMSF